MKKTYVVVIASALVIAAVTGGSRLLAHADGKSGGISLKQLAGSFAGAAEAKYGICLNGAFTALEDCATAPNVIPWNDNATAQCTTDTNGNSCCDQFETNAPVFPGGQDQAQIQHQIIVVVSTSYNPSTASGDSNLTGYTAGPGVKCDGATLVNTAGASPVFTGTQHGVVSDNGNRGDAIVLTIQLSPINGVTGFIGHSFVVRQFAQHD